VSKTFKHLAGFLEAADELKRLGADSHDLMVDLDDAAGRPVLSYRLTMKQCDAIVSRMGDVFAEELAKLALAEGMKP
jgi:hypothetical protein